MRKDSLSAMAGSESSPEAGGSGRGKSTLPGGEATPSRLSITGLFLARAADARSLCCSICCQISLIGSFLMGLLLSVQPLVVVVVVVVVVLVVVVLGGAGGGGGSGGDVVVVFVVVVI